MLCAVLIGLGSCGIVVGILSALAWWRLARALSRHVDDEREQWESWDVD